MVDVLSHLAVMVLSGWSAIPLCSFVSFACSERSRRVVQLPVFSGLPPASQFPALASPDMIVPMRKGPKKLTTEEELYDCAVRALGRRMRSVAEVKRVLRARGAEDSAEAIESVVTRLKQQRYLNDSAYAAAYSAFRRDNEKFGSRRVVADLRSRGVHNDVIEKEVGASYAECDEQQLARDFLRRKRIVKPTNDRETARAFRALMRAGFSIRTAMKLLKNWNVDDEVISALESEAE